MMIEEIQRRLAVAADDAPAPPARVTVTEIYRAGVRRRRVRRWVSVAAVTVTAVGVAGAVTAARASGSGPVPVPETSWGASAEPSATGFSPRNGAPLTSGRRRTCGQLAEAVTAAARSVLPADIRWGATEFPPGLAGAECGAAGIFWVSFSLHGQARRLAFAGGTRLAGSPLAGPEATGLRPLLGFARSGCDAVRRPRTCEIIDGGEVGHLVGQQEYGVLLSLDRDGVFFFLGLTGGGLDDGGRAGAGPGTGGAGQPLSTAQLSVAAQRIAADVFG